MLPLPLIWGLIVFLLLVPLFSDPPSTAIETRALLITAAAFTLIMLPFFALLWQSRLVLTPQGIAHHQFGYTVRSSWANLESLSLAPGTQALFLDEPGTGSVLLRLSAKLLDRAVPGIAPGVIGDPGMLAQGRMIFLAPFMAHWKRGPLREDMLRWAPHLFDSNGKPWTSHGNRAARVQASDRAESR